MKWPMLPLRDLADRIFVGIASSATHAYRDEGVILLRNLNIKTSGIDQRDRIFISQEYEYHHRRKRLKKGDVLTVRTGGLAGDSAVVPVELEGAQCFTALVTRPNPERLDGQFLAYFLNSPLGSQAFRESEAGGNQQNVNAGALERINVPAPPVSEQTVIAGLLSCWDSAIEKTERIIARKELSFRHQCVLQIIRPSVARQWRRTSLRNVFSPVTRKNSVGETNVLTTSAQQGLISQGKYFNKSVSSDDVSGYYLLKKGEFAYNRSSSKGYPFGVIKRLEEGDQGVLSTLYLCMNLDDPNSNNSDFYLHVFESGLLNRELVDICQEGARSHGLLNLSREDFFGLQIPTPPKKEQDSVADFLNLAKREIKLLQETLRNQKLQKQALMQKLLTGQWKIKSAGRTK
jgi:type I restriction enzyme S subunit